MTYMIRVSCHDSRCDHYAPHQDTPGHITSIPVDTMEHAAAILDTYKRENTHPLSATLYGPEGLPLRGYSAGSAPLIIDPHYARPAYA